MLLRRRSIMLRLALLSKLALRLEVHTRGLRLQGRIVLLYRLNAGLLRR